MAHLINTKGFIMFKKVLIIILTSLLCQGFVNAQKLPIKISYIAIPVVFGQENWQVSAQLRVPRNSNTAIPAVVILHSSAGVDSTGAFYARALNNSGIATLELDLWGARDLDGGSENRPQLPQETLPDVFAALAYLAQHQSIDKDRIGVIGFSWGGILSMLTATEQYMDGFPYRFAGHVAHYPLCWLFNYAPGFEFANLTGVPVLIQTGDKDDYDLPETCPTLVDNLPEQDQSLVEVNVYKRAFHAWDRLEPKWIVEDPFSHLGQGGEVTLAPNIRVAYKSRYRVVKFFTKLFKM
jgi:dienelactone hydrolase